MKDCFSGRTCVRVAERQVHVDALKVRVHRLYTAVVERRDLFKHICRDVAEIGHGPEVDPHPHCLDMYGANRADIRESCGMQLVCEQVC